MWRIIVKLLDWGACFIRNKYKNKEASESNSENSKRQVLDNQEHEVG